MLATINFNHSRHFSQITNTQAINQNRTIIKARNRILTLIDTMGAILKTLVKRIIPITIEDEVVVRDEEVEEAEVLEAAGVVEEEEATTLIIMDKHTTSKIMITIIINRARLSLKQNIIRINQIIIRIERNLAIRKIKIQSIRVTIIRKLNNLMTLLQTTRNIQRRLNLLRIKKSCMVAGRGRSTKRAH